MLDWREIKRAVWRRLMKVIETWRYFYAFPKILFFFLFVSFFFFFFFFYDTLKVSMKDFNIPLESWEQSAQDRAKWRRLIRKRADDDEAKPVCEAERKRKERKARAKESTSESSFSELICPICKYWPIQPPENTPTHIINSNIALSK